MISIMNRNTSGYHEVWPLNHKQIIYFNAAKTHFNESVRSLQRSSPPLQRSTPVHHIHKTARSRLPGISERQRSQAKFKKAITHLQENTDGFQLRMFSRGSQFTLISHCSELGGGRSQQNTIYLPRNARDLSDALCSIPFLSCPFLLFSCRKSEAFAVIILKMNRKTP